MQGLEAEIKIQLNRSGPPPFSAHSTRQTAVRDALLAWLYAIVNHRGDPQIRQLRPRNENSGRQRLTITMPLMVGPSRSHPRPIRKCDFARTDWRFQFMDICPKGDAKAKPITQLSFDDFEDDITNLTNGFVLVCLKRTITTPTWSYD
jgi:hypothetical protein